jgi:hypothetical protein
MESTEVHGLATVRGFKNVPPSTSRGEVAP